MFPGDRDWHDREDNIEMADEAGLFLYEKGRQRAVRNVK
jgi:hypothetical protein